MDSEVAIAAQEEPHVKNENVISWEVKSAVKVLVSNEVTSMVEVLLDDILRTLFYIAQSGVQSSVFNTG